MNCAKSKTKLALSKTYDTDINFHKHLEEVKYVLSQRLLLLTAVFSLSIGTLYVLEGDINGYFLLMDGVVEGICYLIVKKSGKYYFPALICLILLTVMNGFNLTISSNFHHTGDFLWAICIITVAYFVLGKKWGMVFTAINLLSIFVMFYLVRHGYIHQLEKPYTEFSQVNFFINLAMGGFIFSYLIIEFIRQIRFIAEQYNSANTELSEVNHDNGKWKEKEDKTEGLGSELIESFVEQLDGTYSIQKGNGTTYVIVFPLRNKE